MDFIFILSILASVCSTFASLPQLLSLKTLSKLSMFLRFVGAILWSFYGFYKQEFVLMSCSAIVACIEITLYLKTSVGPSVPNDT